MSLMSFESDSDYARYLTLLPGPSLAYPCTRLCELVQRVLLVGTHLPGFILNGLEDAADSVEQ